MGQPSYQMIAFQFYTSTDFAAHFGRHFFVLKWFYRAMLRPLALIHKFPTPILRQTSIN
jgi:hypothetical protein